MGARTIKTIIALFISIVLTSLVGLSPLLAGIATISTMEKTVYKSITNLKNQLGANLVGGLFAIIFGLLFGTSVFVICLAIFIYMITITNAKLINNDWVVIGCITILSVLTLEATTNIEFITYSLNRILSIFVGVGVSSFINIFVKSPDQKKLILDKTREIIILAIALNEKKNTISIENFDDEMNNVDIKIMELLDLREEYIKEANMKLSKLQPESNNNIIRDTFESFVRLHNLLETLREQISHNNLDTTLNHDTNDELKLILHYHKDLVKYLFAEERKFYCLEIDCDIEEIKELFIKTHYSYISAGHQNLQENIKIVGAFLDYCDSVQKIEYVVK